MRIVEVNGVDYSVKLERIGARQWIAIGEYNDRTLRQRGLSKNSALAVWRRAAELEAAQIALPSLAD